MEMKWGRFISMLFTSLKDETLLIWMKTVFGELFTTKQLEYLLGHPELLKSIGVEVPI